MRAEADMARVAQAAAYGEAAAMSERLHPPRLAVRWRRQAELAFVDDACKTRRFSFCDCVERCWWVLFAAAWLFQAGHLFGVQLPGWYDSC